MMRSHGQEDTDNDNGVNSMMKMISDVHKYDAYNEEEGNYLIWAIRIYVINITRYEIGSLTLTL